jgi:hypothetical protein
MRVYAHDGSGNLADLLKVSPLEHSSLGILISQNVSSYRGDHSPRFGSSQSQQRNCSFFVQEVTLGGPAYLSGKVQVFLFQSLSRVLSIFTFDCLRLSSYTFGG